jgi:release factor glutamine methyltransferase
MTQSKLTTVGALLDEGIRHLSGLNDASREVPVALEVRVLLGHALRIPRARITSHPETVTDAAHAEDYRRLLARRFAGEPVAYLTGRREFWSLDLAVTPDVLVPRPETELLVERALALRPEPGGRIADLGTGSGAIALALASERPGWRIVATDISAAALGVARLNAAALGLARVEFRLGDWYACLLGERFDLLVSNPPYVAAADPALGVLRHEPRLALTPGADPFESLRALVHGAAQHLAPRGWLVLEHGATQGPEVRAALVLAGFRHVRSHPDLGGHERTTEGQHDQI